ncbi:unnamed protein product, partial [Iphiclides podalirius]
MVSTEEEKIKRGHLALVAASLVARRCARREALAGHEARGRRTGPRAGLTAGRPPVWPFTRGPSGGSGGVASARKTPRARRYRAHRQRRRCR